ncbi:hypothetical protein Tco_0064356 [Tanacetum coccineum]
MIVSILECVFLVFLRLKELVDIVNLESEYSKRGVWAKSMNFVRKFLRALHPIGELRSRRLKRSNDLTSPIFLMTSLETQDKKESNDEECSTSDSEDEEYAMAVRDFKKFFKRRATERQEPKRHFVGVLGSDSGEEDDEKFKDETCLVAHASSEICLVVNLEPNEWIKDSGCSKHMTGNRKLFSTYKAYNGGNVIFGSNLRGNIIGKGYSQNSKAYINLNKHTKKVEESLNLTFDETPPPSKTSPLVDDDLDDEEAIKATERKNLEN